MSTAAVQNKTFITERTEKEKGKFFDKLADQFIARFGVDASKVPEYEANGAYYLFPVGDK